MTQIANLEVPRSATVSQEIQLTGSDGAPLNISGDVFALDVKFKAGDADPPIASADISVTDPDAGLISIVLNGADFSAVAGVFETVSLAYDLIATRDGIPVAIMRGNVVLVPGVVTGPPPEPTVVFGVLGSSASTALSFSASATVSGALGSSGVGGSALVAGGLFLTADQILLTEDVSNTITTNKATALTADGGSIGSTTGGPPATLAYTPTSLDPSHTLATADGASILTAVVSADAGDMLNTARWGSLSNLTKTAGMATPNGLNNGIKLECTTSGSPKTHSWQTTAAAWPAGAENGIYFEFYFLDEDESILPGWMCYPIQGYARFVRAPDTDFFDALNVVCQANILDSYQWGGHTVYRGYYHNGSASLSTIFGYLTPTTVYAASHDATVNAAGHGIVFVEMRPFAGHPPFYRRDRVAFSYNGVSAGIDRFLVSLGAYQSSVLLAQHNDGNASNYAVEVVVPATFDATRSAKYRWIAIGSVITENSSGFTQGAGRPYNNELGANAGSEAGGAINQGVVPQSLSDTHDVIFVMASFPTMPWGATKSDGTADHLAFLGEALPELMHERFNCSINPDDVAIMGYSKAAMAALRVRQAYPEVYGFVGMHDAPYDWDWADVSGGDGPTVWGNQATFDAWQPYDNLAARASTLNDKTRIVISDGSAFPTHYTAMKTAMNTNSIGFIDNGNLGASHNWLATWSGPMVADLVALMDAA